MYFTFRFTLLCQVNRFRNTPSLSFRVGFPRLLQEVSSCRIFHLCCGPAFSHNTPLLLAQMTKMADNSSSVGLRKI